MADFDPNDLEFTPDQPQNLDDIRVIMDLSRLGELIASVAHHLTVLRGIEPPDFDGEEMRLLAVGGWKHVCLMNDRAEFTKSVLSDLEGLPTPESVTQTSVPEHKSEFGL